MVSKLCMSAHTKNLMRIKTVRISHGNLIQHRLLQKKNGGNFLLLFIFSFYFFFVYNLFVKGLITYIKFARHKIFRTRLSYKSYNALHVLYGIMFRKMYGRVNAFSNGYL